jgi:hypothetical protein
LAGPKGQLEITLKTEAMMFEGKYVRWGTWPTGHDLAGQISIELLNRNFTPAELLVLIQELMAVRGNQHMKEKQ